MCEDNSRYLAREGPSEKERMLNRYYKALEYINVDKKTVLDAAAGDGYGLCYLAEKGAIVVGLDIDKNALESYQQNTSGKGLYLLRDITNTGFPNNSFDCVFSVETIEHLPTDDLKTFLKETNRVLKKDGVLVIIMPQRRLSIEQYPSGNHFQEYTLSEFLPFIKEDFSLSVFVDKNRIDKRSDMYILTKK